MKKWILSLAIKFAKPKIKEAVTVDKVVDILAGGVDWASAKAVGSVGDGRLASITKGCVIGAQVCGEIASAVSPEGDGGRVITEAEKDAIKANLKNAVICIITQKQLDGIVDDLCERVLAGLG